MQRKPQRKLQRKPQRKPVALAEKPGAHGIEEKEDVLDTACHIRLHAVTCYTCYIRHMCVGYGHAHYT